MPSRRAYFDFPVLDFPKFSNEEIIGHLAMAHKHELEEKQKNAWRKQIDILREQFLPFETGHIFLEFSIPRMGKRADVIFFNAGVIYVIEFKVGGTEYHRADINQATDYALDLSYFHSGSHNRTIVPVLTATNAGAIEGVPVELEGVTSCMLTNAINLRQKIELFHKKIVPAEADPILWADSKYEPTPTIVEAAQALYKGHSVEEISRSESGATNLTTTSQKIAEIIQWSKINKKKSICFVTGVPGAGKTLAGLNLVCSRQKLASDEHSVFLSGNGPLVDVLREALARDQSDRESIPIGAARTKSKTFIQNIHHFRDDNLSTTAAPAERVVVFDEAQRAWDVSHVAKFMKDKKGFEDWSLSEPEYLISVMDRCEDWCTIICLVGGGQEINDGEAGIIEWINALKKSFKHWKVWSSSELGNSEYQISETLQELKNDLEFTLSHDLHLGVSVRSFRAEELSNFISKLLLFKNEEAFKTFQVFKDQYPIFLTRDLNKARQWLRSKARGSERYGLLAHSGAARLKAEGLNVKYKVEAVDWFLKPIDDVRSSYCLEDIATEFDVQGLELDWTCVCWDADLRISETGFDYFQFSGTKWNKIAIAHGKRNLRNSYRVLLTRARQGIIIYVPTGNEEDVTRKPSYYNDIFDYLKKCGLSEI